MINIVAIQNEVKNKGETECRETKAISLKHLLFA